MFNTLKEDIQTVFVKDPAAKSIAEVLLCYPGLHALWFHRVANYLWRHKFRLLARLISHANRFCTGIEIHPGARIGRRFFIDHGAGVVIGETSTIGDDVLMYQGACLAGTSLKKEKRHPTVGNNVVIGAGAIALGAITIGAGTRIGSGSVVVKSVPPGVTVVGVPGKIVEDRHDPLMVLDHSNIPDPVADIVRLVINEQRSLNDRLVKLEDLSGLIAPKTELTQRNKNILKEFSEGGGI